MVDASLSVTFINICEHGKIALSIGQSIYSRASRYTASSCTDLDNARFWIGSKKFWDTRFLMNFIWDARIFDFFPKIFWDARFFINCYLRCTNFWDARFSLSYTNSLLTKICIKYLSGFPLWRAIYFLCKI